MQTAACPLSPIMNFSCMKFEVNGVRIVQMFFGLLFILELDRAEALHELMIGIIQEKGLGSSPSSTLASNAAGRSKLRYTHSIDHAHVPQSISLFGTTRMYHGSK